MGNIDWYITDNLNAMLMAESFESIPLFEKEELEEFFTINPFMEKLSHLLHGFRLSVP